MNDGTTATTDRGVQDYFERGSARFDNIYDRGEKGAKEQFIDRFFHGTIQRRFEMALEELSPFEGKTILDAGCGPGRYAVEFAVRGADVVGVDFSGKMLELAAENAAARGAAEHCHFEAADFLAWEAPRQFDASVSIGFFEYFRDVQGLFDKVATITDGTLVISFPILWEIRSFPRMLRYKFNRCYLRFFTEAEIEGYVAHSARPIVSHKILKTDRDYLLIAKTVERQS